MNTFLPYPSFEESAKCLDRKRLGKQRLECVQLVRCLMDGGGWAKHPASKMWKDHEIALCYYGFAICDEWRRRGFKDNQDSILTFRLCVLRQLGRNSQNPSWLGNEEFHASHRSNLLRKDPEWYGQFGWTEPDNLPYVWPVSTPHRDSLP